MAYPRSCYKLRGVCRDVQVLISGCIPNTPDSSYDLDLSTLSWTASHNKESCNGLTGTILVTAFTPFKMAGGQGVVRAGKPPQHRDEQLRSLLEDTSLQQEVRTSNKPCLKGLTATRWGL